MDSKIISGKEIANKIAINLEVEITNLKNKGIIPGLAVILVGDNEASKIYVRNKQTRAEALGISFTLIKLSEDISEQQLLTEIKKLNENSKIDGILVQLPLPHQIDENKVINAISPAKDVDGFSPINFGRLWQNMPSIIPSTAGGIMTMLHQSGVNLEGQRVVIINRSNIVGRPLAALMLNESATVTIAHSKTKNLTELTKGADILVSAVGKANFIQPQMVKNDAIVIDVGMNRDVNHKLVGDVDFEAVAQKVRLITPVPGGVGPMTIITLMEQVVEIAKKRA